MLEFFIELEKIPQVYESVVATGIIAGITAALAIYQTYKASKELTRVEEEKEVLRAKEARELSAFEVRQRRGVAELKELGVAQEAAFEQRIAGEGELAYKRATDVAGGELAPAIGGAIQAQKITAIGEFGARQEQQQALNIRYATSIEEGLMARREGITGREFGDIARREEAWGYAGQAGLEGIVESGALAVASVEGRGTQPQYNIANIEKGMSLQAYKDLYYQPKLDFPS